MGTYKCTKKELLCVDKWLLEEKPKGYYTVKRNEILRALMKTDSETFNTILEHVHEDPENENLLAVLTFVVWENDHLDWFNNFEFLEDKKVGPHLKDFLLSSMFTAESIDIADRIFEFFDDENILKHLNSLEEWQEYINLIPCLDDSAFDDDLKIGETFSANLGIILEHVPEEKDRKYCFDLAFQHTKLLNSISIDLFSPYLDYFLEEILDLLDVYYDESEVFHAINNFISKWNEVKQMKEKSEVCEKVYRLLLNFDSLSYALDSYICLMDFVVNDNFEKEDIEFVNLLEKASQEDEIYFDSYLNTAFKLLSVDEKQTLICLQSLLEVKDNESYFDLLLDLYDDENFVSRVFPVKALDSVLKAVKTSFELTTESSDELIDFIRSLPLPEIISSLDIREENQETREIIYSDFPEMFHSDSYSPAESKYYSDWLQFLSTIDAPICQKILDILNLPFVQELSFKDRLTLQKTLMTPTIPKMIDYVYEMYMEKQNQYDCYKKHQESLKQLEEEKKIVSPLEPCLVKLNTVDDLLDSEISIESILDGFDDDEVITPKILVRKRFS